MRAVCCEGKEKIHVETVPDPVTLNPRDAIIKVTTTAICGSDPHIYDGYIPIIHYHAPYRFGNAPAMYRTCRDKHDSCINVVMKPGAASLQ